MTRVGVTCFSRKPFDGQTLEHCIVGSLAKRCDRSLDNCKLSTPPTVTLNMDRRGGRGRRDDRVWGHRPRRHERQGYPNGGTFDDGLWWPAQEWWLNQEAVAEQDRHVVRRG